MTVPALQNIRVLSVGNDNTLLWARELVLKRTGYAVCSAFASDILARDIEFDILVLCRSIAIERAEALARTVKAKHPSVRIVRLSALPLVHDDYFDAVCDPTQGPLKLLAELARLRKSLQTTQSTGLERSTSESSVEGLQAAPIAPENQRKPRR
jgi:hypothetical protein